MGNWNVNSLAFEPADDDTDGISLFREDFVTKQYLASVNEYPTGVRVARVVAKDFYRINLSLHPSPDDRVPPGHTVVPEISFLAKSPETKLRKREIRDLAQQLAQIASKNELYTPPGLPDPVARPKS